MKNLKAVTRFADLDTQRHVTSRTYELLALEARHAIFAENGYDTARFYAEHIQHLPVSTWVKFMRQQYAGAKLVIETQVTESNPGVYFWDQYIRQPDNEIACHIQTVSKLLEKTQSLSISPGPARKKTKRNADDVVRHTDHELLPFSNQCQEMILPVSMLYSDRDTFGHYNMNAFWKIFEEGRWRFSSAQGLTYEKIKEHDTTSFYMGGICHVYEQPVAGEELTLHIRIARIEKIRFYFRQDLMRGSHRIASMEDEQLVVSLSRARPQRVPEFFRELFLPFTEDKSA